MSLLWFRRSKRNERKAEAENASAAAQLDRDARAQDVSASREERRALRIRGLMLLNLKPSDGADRIEHAPPLGTRDEVIRAAEIAAPGIRFDDAGRGEVGGYDHRVTIDLGNDPSVYTAVVSADGAGVDIVRALMERQQWRAYAPRAGVFIEPDALDLFALPDPVAPAEPPRPDA